MRTTSLLPLLLTLAAPLAAQSRFVVDGRNGPGATHTDIQSAIDAAVPGDRILVRAVPGAAYAGFVLDKALDLRATDGGRPVVGASTLRDLPASGICTLEGLEFRDGPPARTALRVERCLGRVVLRDVQCFGDFVTLAVTSALEVTGSALVVHEGGSLRTGHGPVCLLERSNLTLLDLQVSTQSMLGFLFPGGAGITATDSSLVVDDCLVAGGSGAPGESDPFLGRCRREPGRGLPGIQAMRCDVLVTGTSTVEGGPAGRSAYPCPPAQRGPALIGDRFRTARSVVLTGENLANWRPVPIQPSLDGLPGTLPAGSSTTLDLRAEGPGVWGLFIDLQPGRVVLPGIEVPFQLGPTHLPILYGPLDAAGMVSIGIGVPADPALVERVLWFQAGVVRAPEELRISNPASTRVR